MAYTGQGATLGKQGKIKTIIIIIKISKQWHERVQTIGIINVKE